MSTAELEQIIKSRLDTLKMTITPESMRLIVLLSQGFPHYTHLLGLESALIAIQDGRRSINRPDVELGIRSAIEKSKQSIGNVYYKATHSKKKVHLFKEVLLACALAKVDEFGAFSSSDLREPLKRITGDNYEIPGYSQHLEKFSSDKERGPILDKPHRFRFRFKNPLLQPYIIMKGIIDGLVKDDMLNLLEAKEAGNPAGGLLF
jgi:hypothetical protein